MENTEIPVSDIIVNEDILPRIALNKEVLGRYAETIHENIDNIPFPPILVTPSGDNRFILIDGHHRLEAHRITGIERIKAIVVECRDEAHMVEKALVANLKHGLRLSKQEEIRVAKRLYQMGYSTARLSKIMGRSRGTIEYWISELIKKKKREKEEKIKEAVEMVKKGKSIREASKKAGVSKNTVLARLKKEKTGNGNGSCPTMHSFEQNGTNVEIVNMVGRSGSTNGEELKKKIFKILDEAEFLIFRLVKLSPESVPLIAKRLKKIEKILYGGHR